MISYNVGTSVFLWLNMNKKYIEKKLEIDKRSIDKVLCHEKK